MRRAAASASLGRMRTKLLAGAVAAAAACTSAGAAPALADSIVYIKDHDVWVASPDGSKQRQVTRDGTASDPYRSPSQDDRGRIAVAKGFAIRVLTQDGKRLAQFVPRNLKDSTGHSTAGAPAELGLSPDGRRIAYVLTSNSCDLTIDCGIRGTVGIVASDGKGTVAQPGEYGGSDPHWVTNTRLMYHGGFLSQNRVFDLGAAESWNWFDDIDLWPDPGESTDLSDGSVSADGRFYAAIRNDGEHAHVVWYRVNGSILGGPNPGPPTALCQTGPDAKVNDPALAPDGSGIAIGDAEGISVKRGLDDCSGDWPVVARGGSQPDWGPANVSPKPAKAKREPKRR